MLAGFSAALAGAIAPWGRAGIRAENSHSARRAPVRAWVERSGPRPLTMSTLLAAKRSEGLRISATAMGPLRRARGARRRHPNPEEKGGPANTLWWELAGPGEGVVVRTGVRRGTGRGGMGNHTAT